ncbi:hypothetical protein GS610_05510 [Ruegeria sp. HKCCD6228]|uniref:hypothetical protein n=1 Tax=Ruegeria sp. HKCCD6228 TaxID=2683001 RepID=UPI001490B87E|nr:hypothetical protein [Ruegeria sp. HKCCD6228]NOD96661.1 hypothetical protein [Ruegeria sp. HKCCD6228]
MESTIVQEFLDLRDLIFQVLQLCLFVAVLNAFIVEFIKYLYRPYFNRSQVSKWLATLAEAGKGAEYHLSDEAANISNRRMLGTAKWHWLPHRLLLKQIENVAQMVLGDPRNNANYFFLLTSGAPEKDQQLVFEATSHGRIDYSQEQTAQAYDALSAAVSRNLDTLQLQIALAWASRVRATSIASGAAFSIIGAAAFTFPLDVLTVLFAGLIGAISGYASSLIYDVSRRFLGSTDNDW